MADEVQIGVEQEDLDAYRELDRDSSEGSEIDEDEQIIRKGTILKDSSEKLSPTKLLPPEAKEKSSSSSSKDKSSSKTKERTKDKEREKEKDRAPHRTNRSKDKERDNDKNREISTDNARREKNKDTIPKDSSEKLLPQETKEKSSSSSSKDKSSSKSKEREKDKDKEKEKEKDRAPHRTNRSKDKERDIDKNREISTDNARREKNKDTIPKDSSEKLLPLETKEKSSSSSSKDKSSSKTREREKDRVPNRIKRSRPYSPQTRSPIRRLSPDDDMGHRHYNNQGRGTGGSKLDMINRNRMEMQYKNRDRIRFMGKGTMMPSHTRDNLNSFATQYDIVRRQREENERLAREQIKLRIERENFEREKEQFLRAERERTASERERLARERDDLRKRSYAKMDDGRLTSSSGRPISRDRLSRDKDSGYSSGNWNSNHYRIYNNNNNNSHGGTSSHLKSPEAILDYNSQRYRSNRRF